MTHTYCRSCRHYTTPEKPRIWALLLVDAGYFSYFYYFEASRVCMLHMNTDIYLYT